MTATTTDNTQANARERTTRYARLVQTIAERLLTDSVQLRILARYGRGEDAERVRERMQRDITELSILDDEAEPELSRALGVL